MRNKIKSIISLAAIAALSFTVNAQQLKVPAPSPTGTIKQSVALSEITIEYSRPSVKERIIYGDLVPFGKLWRTGANASTKITFGEEVKIEGNTVPAGTYALYTIPDKDEWVIILNKNLTLWGSDGYKQEEDQIRFKGKSMPLANKVETMTFNISNITSTSANIELNWEQTNVSFAITVDIDTKVMKNIETTMAADKRPYFQAANYYYDSDRDLKQALIWINKSVEINPKAYWAMLLKAKIQAKLKDKVGSNASATKVIALAKEDKNDDYVKQAEKLIAENKEVKKK